MLDTNVPNPCNPMEYNLPALCLCVFRQEYIVGCLPFSRGLPKPGIEPESPVLQDDSLLSLPLGKSPKCYISMVF